MQLSLQSSHSLIADCDEGQWACDSNGEADCLSCQGLGNECELSQKCSRKAAMQVMYNCQALSGVDVDSAQVFTSHKMVLTPLIGRLD